MTGLAQLGLFVSSYAPLFAVFALLGTFGKGWPTVACVVLAALGTATSAGVLVGAKKLAVQTLRVGGARARDGDTLAYIATYLVPFAATSATTARERAAIVVFFVLMAVLYVRSELFYVNPLFALAGYRLFEVDSPNGGSLVLLSPRRFLGPETSVTARRLSDYVYWEARS